MCRRKYRILLALFVLLLIAVGAAQIILWTDLPRQWVVGAISREVGVNVTASSLNATLWGRTTVADLTLTLPMEEDPFLSVSHVAISHSSLPVALLAGSLGCRSVRIVDPMVTLRQNETGRWNLQQLASLLSRLTADTKKQARVSLPELEIVNGSSAVVSRTGHIENIGPVHVHGAPHDSTRWDFAVRIPSQFEISGKLGLSPDWAHEIRFDFADTNDLPFDWLVSNPEPFRARGTFYGHLRHGELGGKLQIDHLQYGQAQARGTLGLGLSTAKSAVRIEELAILNGQPALGEFRIGGGSVQLDARQVRADRILIEAGDVFASLSGHWERTAREAELSGSWTARGTRADVRHSGTLNGTLSWPQIGTKHVAVSISGRAKSPDGHLWADLKLQGSGESWATSRWEVLVPKVESQWKNAEVVLEDIRAEIDANWPDVRLVRLSMANSERLNARGEFSAQERNWTASVEAQALRAVPGQGSPVDIKVEVEGGPKKIDVREFRLAGDGVKIESAGTITLPSAELREAYAKVSWWTPLASAGKASGIMSGKVECEAAIEGNLQPTNLDVRMQISGENMAFYDEAIGRLRIPCRAQIDTRRAEYEAGPFQLFGGSLKMSGEHDFSRRASEVVLDADQVTLQPVAELFDLPLKCQGLMKAHLEVYLPLADMNQVTASGTWEVADMNMPPIEAESAQGRIRIQSGTAAFDGIRLKQDQGLASAAVWFRLDQPQRVSVEVKAEKWPTVLPKHNVSFVTDGSGDVILDLSKRTAKGKGVLSTWVAIDRREFGHVSADMTAEGRTVDLNAVKAELLGGTASGTAQIPLDDRLASRIELHWRDLDTAALADWWPGLDGLSGRSSGSLRAMPIDSRRALGRLGLEVRAGSAADRFRGARIGGCRISAQLGEERLVIDRSEIDLMEGTVSVFGNIRLSPGKDSVYVRTDFSRIDLNQLVHVFLPDARPIEGRLSGDGMLVVLSDWQGLTGRADITLEESDLARTAVVSTIYDALNLKFANRAPAGQGQVSVRFEGSSLEIPSFAYFNRGAEIRGAASVEDISLAKASPVTGYAIGSARPLKDVRLPGMEDLDRLMASLQTGVSSVRIRGTLAEPEVAPVPFGEVGRALRALLWSQLGE